MAGHSHWARIRHKKAAADKRRGKSFSRLTRAIIASVRTGGGDPASNLTLQNAIEKARAANMPRDTIERAVKRGTGELGAEPLHEVTYEGYGPGGAALLIHAITDNHNRTGPEIRGILEKHGGTIGKPHSVAWNFDKRALFTVRTDAAGEERLLELAMEAGADDVAHEGASFSITAPPAAFGAVSSALRRAAIPVETADITWLPKSRIPLTADEARRILKIIEALDDHEDVQETLTNGDLPEEVIAEFS